MIEYRQKIETSKSKLRFIRRMNLYFTVYLAAQAMDSGLPKSGYKSRNTKCVIFYLCKASETGKLV